MMKKIKAILGVISGGILNLLMGVPTFAKYCGENDTLLGMKPWYHGLSFDDNCSPILKDGDVGIIIGNITQDLLLLSGVVCVGYIIYAGIQIVLSGGDPAKYAKGKKTLTAAIIGLVISVLAYAIVYFVADVLTGGNGKV